MRSLTLLRYARRTLTAIFLVALAGVLVSVSMLQFIPLSGHQSYIVRGGSMEPTVPLGSIIIVGKVAPSAVVVGDVVTFKTAAAVIVTHRITAIADDASGMLSFTTKGDANRFEDASPWPAQAVVGRVEAWLPYAGIVPVFASTSSGLIAILSTMGALLMLIWGLEGIEMRRGTAQRLHDLALMDAPAPS